MNGDPTTSEYGLLGVRDFDFALDRVPVSADLADLVERHWLVRWSLPPGRREQITLLPQPCVNLIFDQGRLVIGGVGRERFSYECTGTGRVFGVKFRPGGFRPFLGRSVAELTDQVRPLATLWGGPAADSFTAELTRARELADLVAVAERHLRAHWPAPDPEVATVGRIVNALLYDRTITRVDDVSKRFNIPARTLQRLFGRYVGVSPKWVLRRYRLHEAAARLTAATGANWAEVAAELGYFDQSHFIRDFTRAVGLTPAAYAEATRRHAAPLSA
ncbi:MAG TPA: helix-turn-helix domain-containing protein [Actinophytocola sp.]|uniref:helix-turn-helix domain-containing protein n=1 Tax=Actinophytocola sp. TaxID=1872138 RepID=UPI002DB8E8E4|nr:helix-turn-helix domain-containing protein [Actinophytocola sp.]HEU5475095.1 helix-turn-helix domain-containing protein [Actinophytocola sp.]